MFSSCAKSNLNRQWRIKRKPSYQLVRSRVKNTVTATYEVSFERYAVLPTVNSGCEIQAEACSLVSCFPPEPIWDPGRRWKELVQNKLIGCLNYRIFGRSFLKEVELNLLTRLSRFCGQLDGTPRVWWERENCETHFRTLELFGKGAHLPRLIEGLEARCGD